MILTIRTDNPEAEIGLYDNDGNQLAYEKWQAHRQLAETIHQKIQDLLIHKSLNLRDATSIVVYEGPGSYTGLRIGVSVANALAYSFNCPLVAVSGPDWQKKGIMLILAGNGKQVALPNYDAPAKTTNPRK